MCLMWYHHYIDKAKKKNAVSAVHSVCVFVCVWWLSQTNFAWKWKFTLTTHAYTLTGAAHQPKLLHDDTRQCSVLTNQKKKQKLSTATHLYFTHSLPPPLLPPPPLPFSFYFSFILFCSSFFLPFSILIAWRRSYAQYADIQHNL